MLKKPLYLLIFLHVCTLLSYSQKAIEIPYLDEKLPAIIETSESGTPNDFSIETSSFQGVVAQIWVYIEIDHPSPSDLQILFLKEGSSRVIVLYDGQSDGSDPSGWYDDEKEPANGSLTSFSGLPLQGKWTLRIIDPFRGSVGQLFDYSIRVEPVLFAEFDRINDCVIDCTRTLRLNTDGYGSFGDQQIGTRFGGLFHAIPEEADAHRTVYHSSLYFDEAGTFLSSLDMFPSARLESIDLVPIGENKTSSEFEIDGYNVTLTQELIRSASNELVLKQHYLFEMPENLSEPPVIIRYFNSRMRFPIKDELGRKKYVTLKEDETGEKNPELYIYNYLDNTVFDESTYVGISYHSFDMDLIGMLSTEWRENVNRGKTFPEKIMDFGEGVFNPDNVEPVWNDRDGDGVTDPGLGFDVALAMGFKLKDHKLNDNTFEYTAITKWGYGSPYVKLHDGTPTPTPSPTMTPTVAPSATAIPSPTPTVTPTQEVLPTFTSTPSPTPTPRQNTATPSFSPTSTPTPKPRATQTPTSTALPVPAFPFLRQLPDIRLLSGESNEVVLDLDDYVYDPDTPKDELGWQLPLWANRLHIDEHHQLISRGFDRPGIHGPFKITLKDGVYTVSDDIVVKVSSFRLQSSNPLPPIVFNEGETVYHSPYRLNDLLVESNVEDLYLEWFVLRPWPDGIVDIIVHPQSDFTVVTDGTITDEIDSLQWIAKRVKARPTPSPTNEPTSTATYTITPTPLPTSTPTGTNTPTVTPHATNTVMPSFTPTATPTPTYTVQPTVTPTFTATRTPSRTPTRTPTQAPAVNCSDNFEFRIADSISTFAEPVQMVRDANGDLIVVHYNDGLLARYRIQNGSIQSDNAADVGFGAVDAALGDVDEDGQMDIFVLNPFDENLILINGNDFSRMSVLDLFEENIPNIFDIEKGVRLQALTAGDLDGDAIAECVVRLRDELLVVKWDHGQLEVAQRIEIDGSTRFIKGEDLNQDGQLDILLTARTTGERIQIYTYQNEALERVNELATDQEFTGNYAREIVFHDWNGDGLVDLGVLLFSGESRLLEGQSDFRYGRLVDVNPIVTGIVDAVDFADFDGDGLRDYAILQRNQHGLVFNLACGEQPLNYTHSIQLVLSSFAPKIESYDWEILDWDGDGDLDILVSRSFANDIMVIENVSGEI